MATNFDYPPLYDPLTKKGDFLADEFLSWFSTFMDTLTAYLTEGGIFLPQITTTQRDALQNTQNGQMIYNTTLNSAQYFKNGTWTSI